MNIQRVMNYRRWKEGWFVFVVCVQRTALGYGEGERVIEGESYLLRHKRYGLI